MTIELPTWFPIPGLVIALLALILAIKNYRRKSGLHIRGSFQLASSIECSDKYISGVVIENLKDRSVTIFAVYLRVGFNYYIEIENFEAKPIVLKAYETYHKEYGPIQCYGFNSRRFKMNKILSDESVRKTLVLSTSDGKYVVPKPIKTWNPVSDFFKNHSTAIIRPISTTYKDIYIGENVKYVIEIVGKNKHEEVILISDVELKFNRFKNFRLTKESLETKERLEEFLEKQVGPGKIECEKIVVFDTAEWHRHAKENYRKTIDAVPYGWFRYRIVGRVNRWLRDREMRRKSRKIVREEPISKKEADD